MMRSRWKTIAVSFSAVVAGVFIAGPSLSIPPTTQAMDLNTEMLDWWNNLENTEPWASQALLKFSSHPDATVTFFKEHLKPLKIEQKELDELLEALGSDDEKVWKPAFEKLDYFDPRLNVDLSTLMSDADTTVKRDHLVEVLCDDEPDSRKGQNIELVPYHVGGDGFNFLGSPRYSLKVVHRSLPEQMKRP